MILVTINPNNNNNLMLSHLKSKISENVEIVLIVFMAIAILTLFSVDVLSEEKAIQANASP